MTEATDLPGPPEIPGLSARDVEILEFESSAPRSIAVKEEAIRSRFDMSSVRYHQRLNVLVDVPAAAENFPVLVGRLRRIRDERDNVRRAAAHNDTPDN